VGYGILYCDMEHYTAIWNIRLRYGILYCDMEHYTAIWNIILRYGILYCDMEHYTAIWNIILRYGALYSDMEHYTAIWSIILRYGTLYCDMEHYTAIKIPQISFNKGRFKKPTFRIPKLALTAVIKRLPITLCNTHHLYSVACYESYNVIRITLSPTP